MKEYKHTFTVNLNSKKMRDNRDKQIENLYKGVSKTYFFNGEKYIELK